MRGHVQVSALVASLTLMTLSLAVAQPPNGPVITAADAVRLASACTGLPDKNAASAAELEITDSSVPLFEVTALPVWEIRYDDVKIAVPQPDGEDRENPNLHTIHVWIRRDTGALVRVFTPTPGEGALALTLGPQNAAFLSDNGLSVKASPETPVKPLVAVLPMVDACKPGSVLQARHIIASYGLVTYRAGQETLLADRPAWFVHLGGVSQPFTSGGSMLVRGAPAPVASEMLVILDAATGESLETYLVGGPS